MRVELRGLAKLHERLEVLKAERVEMTVDELRRTALDVHATAVKSIQRGSKSGAVYKKGKIEHQASAPGEAPASDTGTLVRMLNVDFELTGREKAAFIRSSAPYSASLEYGTKHAEPRPFMHPAYLEALRRHQARVRSQS